MINLTSRDFSSFYLLKKSLLSTFNLNTSFEQSAALLFRSLKLEAYWTRHHLMQSFCPYQNMEFFLLLQLHQWTPPLGFLMISIMERGRCTWVSTQRCEDCRRRGRSHYFFSLSYHDQRERGCPWASLITPWHKYGSYEASQRARPRLRCSWGWREKGIDHSTHSLWGLKSASLH